MRSGRVRPLATSKLAMRHAPSSTALRSCLQSSGLPILAVSSSARQHSSRPTDSFEPDLTEVAIGGRAGSQTGA
ncbi:hypothetical protein CMUS01_13110 [Colletotrichum musicola]|uniref:Uncharacterized protein n=1 Tax=Colletotrichum musicola TaxID=2175873 RepID=A0A8H6MXU4_9PEZI|nr:hypothetical protein CMUS01_13110 [Colletotrichum musicola]